MPNRIEDVQLTQHPATPKDNDLFCSNCRAEIQPSFAYCPACGQETGRKIVPLRSIAREFAEDYFSFDSKILRSLYPLLFRPGFLTEEFLQGRRARYIPPLRMYLTISLIAFLLLAWNKPSLTTYRPGSAEITTEELEDIRKELAAPPSGEIPAQEELEARLADAFWDNFFNSVLPKLFFVMVPLAALILFALYRKSSPYYVEHVIFSLHFHSFVFVLLSVYLGVSSFLLQPLVLLNRVLLAVLLTYILVYLFMALRKVHKQSPTKTAVQFGVLVGTYTVAFIMSLMTALLINYSLL